MQFVDAEQILSHVRMPALIEALKAAFAQGCSAPLRQVVAMPGGAGDRLFLSMPAFDAHGSAVKLVTIFPDNGARQLPTVHAAIVMFSSDGLPVALLDGTSLTRLRTAAASALASSYLSRPDSAQLVVVGTGSLAPHMALAHSITRPIRRIVVWGRRPDRARDTARAIGKRVDRHIEVLASDELEPALAQADIVSCATNSSTPILPGAWVKPGTHVDLVGAYAHDMRESDDDLVRHARLFVDTFEGALAEAGDLLDPMRRGVISREQIEAELSELVTQRHPGRGTAAEITVFKSVGAALEDLAAARLALESVSSPVAP